MSDIIQNINSKMGRAGDVVDQVQKSYLSCRRGKQPDHEVALYWFSVFGQFRVFTLFAASPHLLLMNIQTSEGHPDILYCPPEQGVFQIRHFVPKDPVKDKVLVGFGVQPEGS